MKVKIDYLSILFLVLCMVSVQIFCSITELYVVGSAVVSLICDTVIYLSCFAEGYFTYCFYKDGNWLIDNRVFTIEVKNNRLLLNGSYKTKWLCKCRRNDVCTCADFRTGTVYLQTLEYDRIVVCVPT